MFLRKNIKYKRNWASYDASQHPTQTKLTTHNPQGCEINNMASIKEQAKAYTAPQTKNIAELAKVPVDIDMTEAEYTKDDGSSFKVLEIEWEDSKYRVPRSVLAQLKALLEAKPDMAFFKVNKTGEGLKTTYMTIPME